MFTYTRFATDESLTESDLHILIINGKIQPSALLQRSDSTDWKSAGEYAELKRFFSEAPTVPQEKTKPRTLRKFVAKFTQIEERDDNRDVRFVGLWFAVLGSVAVFWMVPRLQQDIASEEWPAVQAIATGWSIYEYEVAGRTYPGNHPDGYLHRGQKFTVHYDPRHPERSLTKTGASGEEIGAIVMFGLFAIMGVVMIIKPGLAGTLLNHVD